MSVRKGGKVIAGNVSHYNIGDTFMTKRTDTSLAGAVECDGATYNTTDFTGDGSIGELLEAGKLDYISLSAYSTAISTKGWCDKIGWNGTGTTTFRVPTLTPRIIQTNNISVVGNGTNVQLQILEGKSAAKGLSINATSANVQALSAGGLANPAGLSTDPTKSGIIADTSDTAQLRVMIQLAVATTDEAVATCTGVLADVADLKDHRVIAFQAPTAQNNYTWYRKYADGWVEQGGIQTGERNAELGFAVDLGAINLPVQMANSNYYANGTNTTFLLLGKIIKNTNSLTLQFVPYETSRILTKVYWTVCGMAA